jgi:hypothetical protein
MWMRALLALLLLQGATRVDARFAEHLASQLGGDTYNEWAADPNNAADVLVRTLAPCLMGLNRCCTWNLRTVFKSLTSQPTCLRSAAYIAAALYSLSARKAVQILQALHAAVSAADFELVTRHDTVTKVGYCLMLLLLQDFKYMEWEACKCSFGGKLSSSSPTQVTAPVLARPSNHLHQIHYNAFDVPAEEKGCCSVGLACSATTACHAVQLLAAFKTCTAAVSATAYTICSTATTTALSCDSGNHFNL